MEGLRNPRFTPRENDILVEGVMSSYDQLYGSLSCKTKTSQKYKLWAKICRSVSASGVFKRTPETCKKRFGDIKLRLKRKMADAGRHACGTGGGPPASLHLHSYEEKIYSIMNSRLIFGIGGNQDIGPSTSHSTPGESYAITSIFKLSIMM
ncbi:hypothetical protein FKM82_027897 [Ascaphus truei]